MKPASRARITRLPSAPPCEGIRIAGLDGLLAALDERGVVSPVVADLTLGAWRGQELARTCFAQLGIEWPLRDEQPDDGELAAPWIAALNGKTVDGRAAASAIGDWIDSEGRGNASALAALMLAEHLLGALGERSLSLVVLAPRFGLPWQTENFALLRFLAYGARAVDRVIVVGQEEVTGLSARWSDAPSAAPRPQPTGLAALVPGALDAETAQALQAAGHPLEGGFSLVPPEWRQPPTATSRLQHDQLAAAPVDSWLRAYAFVHGNNYFVDPWFLCREANSRLAEGGGEIALLLMERAANCARSPADRATLLALTQGFRIALLRYQEVTTAPDPSPTLPPFLRGAMLMTKGWGLVMSGEAERAEPYMQGARELLGPVLGCNRQFLYLLNISALNRVRLGDIAGALTIENQIEAASATLEDRDNRLDYVNFINLARLHRLRDDLDLAERYYERAFATTAGARTESDLVYTNVCMARLDTARGRAHAAFLAWLRASMHWLASDLPEGLGWRVLSVILGRKATPAETPPDSVAEALAKWLRIAARAAGIDSPLKDGLVVPTAFVRVDRASFESARAFGAPGVGVICADTSLRAAFNGPHQEALAALVRALLARVVGAPALIESLAIVVDDRFGQEMPTTLNQLIATCVRLGVDSALFSGRELKLPAERRAALFEQARVRRGPAVLAVERNDDAICIHFRRYLPPRTLSLGEAHVMAECGDSDVTFAELRCRLKQSTEETLRYVRELESSRAIEVRLEIQ